MDKVLKIYYSNNGVEAPFPNSELQAELYSFQYDCKRMGTAPTITASVMYPLCLDNYWTDNTYVYFRGEKYYLSNKPSSSYSNTDARYKHELTFVSERKILENIYFTDGILTDFHFFGDLLMLADRLNAFFTQSSLSYRVYIDSGITTEEKDVEINKLYVNDALAKGFEIFNIPYYFVGTDIHFGYYQNEIGEIFEYGVDNALLSVNRENSNNKIVTRITGVGSSENIPYYYPNFNESGEHDVTTDPTGYANDISKLNYLKIDPYTSLRNGGYAQYYKACVNPIGNDLDKIIMQVDDQSDFEGYVKSWDEYLTTYMSGGHQVIIHKNFTIKVNIKSKIGNIITLNKKLLVKAINISQYIFPETINVVAVSYNWDNLGEFNYENLSYNDSDDYITFNYNSTLDNITNIYVELSYNFQQHIGGSAGNKIYTEFTYDTKYSTSSTNIYVYSSDYDINEKTYLNFNKVINYPNGTKKFVEHIFYQITREVAGYSSCYFDCSFKAVFLDNNGDDMSEWNIYSAKPTALFDDDGNNLTYDIWYNETSRYAHFRNTSSSSKVITATMVALVIMDTEETAYGVELEYIPDFGRNEKPYDYWKFHDGKEVKYSVAGIKFNDTSAIPDGLKVKFSATKKWIEPKPYLMPSTYRKNSGKNIWYNSVSNRYKDENGDLISFLTPYSPKEHISDPKEYIKPSIVGITVNGQRIDQFADIAFDTNDNNNEWITDDDGNNQTLKHSFFFVKLRRMDFNLFDQALEKGEMTISMTSGHCGSCNFTIMVDEETQQNTVQVDENGNLKRDDDGNVITYGTPQDVQQDTTQAEVWIALRKEEDSYGVIMPDTASNLIPIAKQDTFVFTNILLPNSYIENAEQKLEWELLKELKENNEEKFDFSIDFSRIYLAENPIVYKSINENAKVYVKYNNIKNELYIDSYSYRMDADKPLPQIKVDLKRSISIVKNAIQRSEGKIIQYVKEVTVINQKKEATPLRSSEKSQNKDIDVVQEMGFSETSVMSQKAVTEAINAVEGSNVEVAQYMGQSTEKVMSQKAVTNEIGNLSNLIDSKIVQEKGGDFNKSMSQKAVTDALTLAKPTFDGIDTSVRYVVTTETYDSYDGSVVYDSSRKQFAYKVGTYYYRIWHSSAMYNTTAPKALTNTVFKNTSNNQDYIFDGTDLVLLTSGNGGIGTMMKELSYSELKSLYDGGNLTKGMQYRITDYVTTCNSAGSVSGVTTSSAGHPFDIIVTADSNSTLNANARVCLHDGDTYFANNKLSEWVIKYDINNDTSKYQWADTINGKGVIYYMEDEFGNECAYDFKNILFNGKFTFDLTNADYSLQGERCYENKIKGYYSYNKLILNNNVFNNTISWNNRNNFLSINCHSNIFNNACSDIRLGIFCSYNKFADASSNVTLGNNCSHNELDVTKSYFKNIVIENNCSYNKVVTSETTSENSIPQNLKIISGVSGASSAINEISIGLNNSYVTKVAKNSSGEIKTYNEADLVS